MLFLFLFLWVPGINVFGVIFHTHMLGRKVKLRHIRDKVEFEPIAQDMNYDVNYQEYRSLRETRKVLKVRKFLIFPLY